MTDDGSMEGATYQSLCEPTPGLPWAVGAMGALPVQVVETNKDEMMSDETAFPSLSLLARARPVVREGPWSVLVVPSADDAATTAFEIYVWHTAARHSLAQQKFATAVSTLTVESRAGPPLVALQPPASGSSNAAACLYVLLQQPGGDDNDNSSLLSGYQVEADAGRTLTTPRLGTLLPLEAFDVVTNLTCSSNGNATNTSANVVWVGTRVGRLYWLTPRPATGSLPCQAVTSTTTSAPSFLSSLFTPSKRPKHHHAGLPDEDILQVLATPEDPHVFWSLTQAGGPVQWRATQNNPKSPKMDFDCEIPSVSLADVQAVTSGSPLRACAWMRLAQAEACVLHALVQTVDVEGAVRWYALTLEEVVNGSWQICRATWLSRLGPQATCHGWVATAPGAVYALVQPLVSAWVLLAVTPDGFVYEYDNFGDDNNSSHSVDDDDDVIVPLPSSLQADYATHGVTFGTPSGLWLRAQVRAVVTAVGDAMPVTTQAAGQHVLLNLLQHLRASFVAHYRTATAALLDLPPSWHTPEARQYADQVVLELGKEHVQRSNGLAMHLAYLDFLQLAGLYRSLRVMTKWQLLAYGQELAAVQALPLQLMPEMDGSSTPEGDLAEFLLRYQERFVLPKGFTETSIIDPIRLAEWTTVLASVMSTAATYRAERASFPYDLPKTLPSVSKRVEVPLWQANPLLQKTLKDWVQYHFSLHTSSKDQTSATGWTSQQEIVLLATLESFATTHQAVGEKTRVEYWEIQRRVIPLLYGSEATRELAWSLAMEHRYFAALCQLAKNHEKEEATPFQLQPLFKGLGTQKDVGTGMEFATYVLKWHIDRQYFGHALDYGKYCPMVLHQMVQQEESFRPYRWIVAVQHGDFNQAADFLLDRAAGSSVSQTKVFTGLAKLSNGVAAEEFAGHEEQTQGRDAKIERLRERATAQEYLLGESDETRSKPLWSAERLLNYAMAQFDRQDSLSEKIEICCKALGVCTTFESLGDTRQGATRVWKAALMADLHFLQQFVLDAPTLEGSVMDKMYEMTVLGGLMQQTEDIPSYRLDPQVGERILDGLPPQDRAPVSRLLRHLCSME